MTPEKKLKTQRANIRKIVRSSSTQQEAIKKLIEVDGIVSKSQAKRLWFQLKG